MLKDRTVKVKQINKKRWPHCMLFVSVEMTRKFPNACYQSIGMTHQEAIDLYKALGKKLREYRIKNQPFDRVGAITHKQNKGADVNG